MEMDYKKINFVKIEFLQYDRYRLVGWVVRGVE